MRAMVLQRHGEPLVLCDVSVPVPRPSQLLIRVRACGVCRTDLHICDGELPRPKLPLIPGHEIVGEVVSCGAAVHGFRVGERVGVPWLAHTCQHCAWCMAGRENLCDKATFTGYQCDGGYAEYTAAEGQFCLPVPNGYGDVATAPLLCAGSIGCRALRMTGDPRRLGIYGFGAAAHIVAQVAKHEGREVYAFTRPDDAAGQEFARGLGVDWAGGSEETPPHALDAAIIFAPVGDLVPMALRAVQKAGVVVCAGIHMSDIPSFPYALLWGERVLRSVANLTRKDGLELMNLVPQVPVRTEVQCYPLTEANTALADIRAGRVIGAAVLQV